jgi:hypothetical protein
MYFLQGLAHFDEILEEADGIILSRGNLGIDLPPEKVAVKSDLMNFQYVQVIIGTCHQNILVC